MGYSISGHNIDIHDDAVLHVITRSGGETVDTFNLNTQNVKIRKDGGDFFVIGTSDTGEAFSSVKTVGNTVEITTDSLLVNVGSTSSINLNNKNAFIKKEGTKLKFYTENV